MKTVLLNALTILNVQNMKVKDEKARYQGQRVFVITTNHPDPKYATIIRDEKQFRSDVTSSFLSDDPDTYYDLIGGAVSGKVEWKTKGEDYTDFRDGSTKQRLQDGLWIDGFLNLRVSQDAYKMRKIAREAGKFLAVSFGVSTSTLADPPTTGAPADATSRAMRVSPELALAGEEGSHAPELNPEPPIAL